MKMRWTAGVLGTALISGFLAEPGLGKAEPSSEQDALERVAPVPVEEEGADDSFRRVFQESFDADRWRARLELDDLDERERAFEDLTRRAGIDLEARAFLEELARTGSEPELAWTARLALREVNAKGSSSWRPRGVGASFLEMDQRLEQMLEQFMAEARDPALFTNPRGRFRMVPFGSQGGTSSTSRQVEVRTSEEGTLLRVTEDVDGEQTTREYSGESLEDIYEAHPELKQELGLRVDGLPQGHGLSIQLPGSGGRIHGSLLDPFAYGDRAGKMQGGKMLEWRSPEGGLQGFFAPTSPRSPISTDKLGVIVRPLSEGDAESFEVAGGLRVVSVFPATLADYFGLVSGDLLLELNGIPLVTAEELTRVLGERAPDESLTLEWLDDLGQRHSETWSPDAGTERD